MGDALQPGIQAHEIGCLGTMEQKTGVRGQYSPSLGSPGCRKGRSAPRATDSGSANA
jgi:hypothetical protein